MNNYTTSQEKFWSEEIGQAYLEKNLFEPELRKEKRGEGPMLPGSGGSGEADGLFGITPDMMKNILTLGLGSVFTLSALKQSFKVFGKKLLRGGIVASIISLNSSISLIFNLIISLR